jgi:hypothetical protein
MSLWDVVQFATGNGDAVSYMASDAENLQNGLEILSDYVKLYCSKALSGDLEFYKAIKSSKDLQEQENALKSNNQDIEYHAKAVWENARYDEVIELYQSIKEELTPIQEKRMYLSMKRRSQKTDGCFEVTDKGLC